MTSTTRPIYEPQTLTDTTAPPPVRDDATAGVIPHGDNRRMKYLPPNLGTVCETCGLSGWTRALDRPDWRRLSCLRCPHPAEETD